MTQIRPSLERVLVSRLAHPAVVDLLGGYPTPAALQRAGRGHAISRLKKLVPRIAERLTDEIFGTLAEQTTVVTDTNAAEHIVGRLPAQLQQLAQQQADIETEIMTVVEAYLRTCVLISVPGIGTRTSRILTEVVSKDFKSAAPLASYAGIPPVTRQSGTSIRGESPSRRDNKAPKRALFLSAFASIKGDPTSRILRKETPRRKTPQPIRHRPDQTTFRHPRCHAARPHPTTPVPVNNLSQAP